MLDFTGPRQQGVKVAIFLDQQGGGFQPDAGCARDVVDTVTRQRLHIDDAGRGHAELFKHLVGTDGLVLHRVEHVDAGADKLHQVLVGRNDGTAAPSRLRLQGEGGNDVIRLEPIHLDAGDVEGAGGVTSQGKLRAQVFGQGWAVGFVLVVQVIAEGVRAGVKDHGDMGGGGLAANGGKLAPHQVAEPGDGPHRQPIRFARQRRQRVIGAEDEGRAVDEVKVMSRAERHECPLYAPLSCHTAPGAASRCVLPAC